MQQLVILFHILFCLALISLVLLQQGKGANMGPAFGSGASNTLFGSRGPASFLMKLTGTFAALFFITALALSFFIAQTVKTQGQLSVVNATQSVPNATPELSNSTQNQNQIQTTENSTSGVSLQPMVGLRSSKAVGPSKSDKSDKSEMSSKSVKINSK